MKILMGFWYSFLVVALLIAAFTGFLEQHVFYTGGWSKAPLIAKIGIPTVFITFIVFWIIMLEDFIENKDTQYRWPIALCMFFLHWIAILIYFWAVVYRRKSP